MSYDEWFGMCLKRYYGDIYYFENFIYNCLRNKDEYYSNIVVNDDFSTYIGICLS
ncbi:hypothetical protein [Escherichia phage vB_EcoM_JNE01]|nr:hypothetical protein [Escherichia phage vB_EcoM_JNE01]